MTEAKKTESSLQEKTLALSGDMAYLEQSDKKKWKDLWRWQKSIWVKIY